MSPSPNLSKQKHIRMTMRDSLDEDNESILKIKHFEDFLEHKGPGNYPQASWIKA